jgi:hypothetical protein
MGKKKKGSSSGSGSGYRIRKNPLTGEVEQVPGTRAGRKRNRLPFGHPLRTHDLMPTGSRKKRAEDVKEEHKNKKS